MNPYPKVGDIRTIAVEPALTKCFEAVVLRKL